MEKTLEGLKACPYHRKALQGYYARMSKDNDRHLWDNYVGDILKEQGFTDIIDYPQSIYHVDALFQALGKYGPDHSFRVPMTASLKQAMYLARKCFAWSEDKGSKLSIHEFTPRFVYSITSNHRGSSGLTAWGVPKAEAYVRAYERGRQILLGEKHPEPCIAFARTQRNKTRLVWGYPYSMTAVEGILARPLIERFKEGGTPMAFGMANGALGTRLMTRQNKRKFAYGTDISSFDSSAPAFLINFAFDVLLTWFKSDEIEPSSGKTVREIGEVIRNYFVTTPIVMPDQMLYTGKKHGVPSGSYFTQMVDSIINVVYAFTAALDNNMNVSLTDIFVLGDDIVFFSDEDRDLKDIATSITKNFNANCNPDKCDKFYYNEPIKYLGRYWFHGIPDLPIPEILGRMTQPERFRVYSKDEIKRQREIRLLFLAYVNTYYSAYQLIRNMLGPVNRHHVDQTTFERLIFGSTCPEFLEDHLNGLMRYQIKYENQYSSKSMQPLALMFWK